MTSGIIRRLKKEQRELEQYIKDMQVIQEITQYKLDVAARRLNITVRSIIDYENEENKGNRKAS